jgi:lipid-A-disaccharide synthase-like uncharacterized protein
MGIMMHWYLMAIHHPYGAWDGVGFLAQAIFGARFYIQWLKSEAVGRSVIPIAFWYCSIIGALLNLAYFIHLESVPLIVGSAAPLAIYVRNLYLTYRERAKEAAASSS